MFSFATRLVPSVRFFSSTAVPQYPKLKSHSGAKKRWKSLPNGKFKRVCTYLLLRMHEEFSAQYERYPL